MKQSFFLLCALLCCVPADAKQLSVKILAENGKPLPGVVVEAHGSHLATDPETSTAIMDQVNKQFKPHILIVEKGDNVEFPNSDSIQHHVYSFSPAKTFELRLYKDRQPSPISFEQSGVVALGCNIHDWMVGYIYVASSSNVTRSNEHGLALLKLPEQPLTISLWHPRMHERDLGASVSISAEQRELTIKLTQPMYPKLDEDIDEFDDYE